ncbi:TRMO [Lepeophtheirus salmonis]|uniref:TRMO n=1 Tax=Lepeophtheirus salmonis TaxID=72036 RepID=A0A7R8H4K5_LEPSM|nr:TRMO [Lepeophtheirus salmonis]CAF2850168.1 TRMO [Lepeophtheirus salmonis]
MIARVVNGNTEDIYGLFIRTKNGTPRQGNICQESHGTLEVNLGDNNAQYALENLHEFSHVWIIFVFHKNGKAFTKTKVTPPRLSSRVGVFSTRSPHRPNPHRSLSYVKPYVPSYDSPSTLEGSKQETIKFPDWIKKTSSLTCKADPRSCYRKDKCSDKLYFFSHDGVHLTAWFDDEDNMRWINHQREEFAA